MPTVKTVHPFDAYGKKLCGCRVANSAERGDAVCKNLAGFGTDHPGYGSCKWHFGCTQRGKTTALKEEMDEYMANMRLGDSIPIDPADALIQAVWRAYGFVKYLEMLAGNYESNDLVEQTEQGSRPKVWIDVYAKANLDLAKISEMCLRAGVQERKIRLAEQHGEMVARSFLAILGDLDLNEEQKRKAPALFRRHMMALGGVLDVSSTEVEPEAEPAELTT